VTTGGPYCKNWLSLIEESPFLVSTKAFFGSTFFTAAGLASTTGLASSAGALY
jgi:hypothetical protein